MPSCQLRHHPPARMEKYSQTLLSFRHVSRTDPAQYSSEEIEAGRVNLAEKAIARGGHWLIRNAFADYGEWPTPLLFRVWFLKYCRKFRSIGWLFSTGYELCLSGKGGAGVFLDTFIAGRVVLFDDYSYYGCEQQAEAIDAATASLGVSVLSLPTGQGLVD